MIDNDNRRSYLRGRVSEEDGTTLIMVPHSENHRGWGGL